MQSGRQAFDDAVIAAFGLDIDRQRIYDALLSRVNLWQDGSFSAKKARIMRAFCFSVETKPISAA